MKIHELKTWPEIFQAVLDGRKTWEFRRDDRNFQEGHVVRLMEYNPENCEYTGRAKDFRVGYIIKADRLGNNFGIPMDYCVFSLEEQETHVRSPKQNHQ